MLFNDVHVFNKAMRLLIIGCFVVSNELASCSESSRVRRMSLDAWLEEPPRSVLQDM